MGLLSFSTCNSHWESLLCFTAATACVRETNASLRINAPQREGSIAPLPPTPCPCPAQPVIATGAHRRGSLEGCPAQQRGAGLGPRLEAPPRSARWLPWRRPRRHSWQAEGLSGGAIIFGCHRWKDPASPLGLYARCRLTYRGDDNRGSPRTGAAPGRGTKSRPQAASRAGAAAPPPQHARQRGTSGAPLLPSACFSTSGSVPPTLLNPP